MPKTRSQTAAQVQTKADSATKAKAKAEVEADQLAASLSGLSLSKHSGNVDDRNRPKASTGESASNQSPRDARPSKSGGKK